MKKRMPLFRVCAVVRKVTHKITFIYFVNDSTEIYNVTIYTMILLHTLYTNKLLPTFIVAIQLDTRYAACMYINEMQCSIHSYTLTYSIAIQK